MTALAQRAARALQEAKSPDALHEVKDMLRRMVASALNEQAKSSDLKAFCDKEVLKSNTSLKELTIRVEKAQANIDKLTAEADEQRNDAGELRDEAVELRDKLAKAAEKRAKENQAYLDAKAADENQAPSRPAAGLEADSAEARAKQAALQDEALKRRMKAETAEAAASLAFRRDQQDGEEQIRQKLADAKAKEDGLIKRQKDISDAEQDMRALKEEFEASQEYAKQITKQCAVPAEPAEVRKRRRQDQIGSLKDAYMMLGGGE